MVLFCPGVQTLYVCNSFQCCTSESSAIFQTVSPSSALLVIDCVVQCGERKTFLHQTENKNPPRIPVIQLFPFSPPVFGLRFKKLSESTVTPSVPLNKQTAWTLNWTLHDVVKSSQANCIFTDQYHKSQFASWGLMSIPGALVLIESGAARRREEPLINRLPARSHLSPRFTNDASNTNCPQSLLHLLHWKRESLLWFFSSDGMKAVKPDL